MEHSAPPRKDMSACGVGVSRGGDDHDEAEICQGDVVAGKHVV